MFPGTANVLPTTGRTGSRETEMRKAGLFLIVGALGTMVAVGPAGAAPPDEARIRVIAGNCLLCHNAAAAEAGGIVSLHGQDPKAIAAGFRDYRDGKRHGTIMPRIAKGYDDASIDALAVYLANTKK